MTTLKWVYKVLRGVLFSAIIVVAALFAIVYTALSIPPVQDYLRGRIETELRYFLGSHVEVGNLSIRPVNEAIIEEVRLFDLDGKECLYVKRLGAGINIWRLVFSGEIEITYVELLDFKADIYQKAENEPLNIDFVVQAFAPKNKNKPPAKFDLKIHNIVVRGGEVEFNKLWKEQKSDGTFDKDHLSVTNFCADITIPRLSNQHSEVDLRRLSFEEKSGLQVKEIGGYFTINPELITVSDFNIQLPETVIKTSDFIIPLSLISKTKKSTLQNDNISLRIRDSKVTPSNLSAFYKPLSSIDVPIPIEVALVLDTDKINIENLKLGPSSGFSLTLTGKLEHYSQSGQLKAEISDLDLFMDPTFADLALSRIPQFSQISSTIKPLIEAIGAVDLKLTGSYDAIPGKITVASEIISPIGKILTEAITEKQENEWDGIVKVEIPNLNLSGMIPDFPMGEIRETKIIIDGRTNLQDIKSATGSIELAIGYMDLLNRSISNISGHLQKKGNICSLELNLEDENLNGNVTATAELNGVASKWEIEAIVNDFDTYSSFLADDSRSGFEMSGKITAHATGNHPDNLLGTLNITDFHVTKTDGKKLDISSLTLDVTGSNELDEYSRTIKLESAIVDLMVKGDFVISKIPGMVKRTLGEILPTLTHPYFEDSDCGSGIFTLSLKEADQLIDFFQLPVFPLTEMELTGGFDSNGDRLQLETVIPFIQQGDNKLITGTYLNIEAFGKEGTVEVKTGTVYPTKKGLLKIDAEISGVNGLYDIELAFNRGRDVSFHGYIELKAELERDQDTGMLKVKADCLPSILYLNDAEWKMEESEIAYTGNILRVEDFCIRHEDQYVIITGYNTTEGDGTLRVLLSDISLDYIFETLNINHVTFGGNATGEIIARRIFSKDPEIQTQILRASDFSYNNALLGNADLRGMLNLPEKMIAIGAVVRDGERTVADVDGGVWFGRDSLAFNFDANKVNVAFMQPFMSAFSSDIKGLATGHAHLYGTFSDIDMTGIIVAEDVEVKVDYINVSYVGNDTVYLFPGRIELPRMTVKDKYGHTALLNGELTHSYFHDPVFNFRITEMDKLLVYDTNAKINPLWYGELFASGSGEITGRPGLVRIAADVQTESGSDFTFVLSDQQEAVKSHFLTFTDRKKEAELLKEEESIPEFLQKFRQTNTNQEDGASDIFVMDFRVSVTEDVKFNLIMDPVAGDKITAYGDGAMNMTYSSLTDELKLYGKYVLEKGTYNFSLQDIILKEFIIKPGSSIAFTGNPYTGTLDIVAAYKVNTSLTELDQSFANDRELNRTSVPVEALLKVTGVLTSPNIDFDIELPTVTEETAQKVRSIISTEDMMSKQVIYLVALNKFYPPEYMTTSNSGGEWASIASSTLSSQLQNMIGQITDKFTIAPSIRSDKGDFSDLEVDLALSSQLFNNRLLINGNLGYRDPSNSSTTFVGDFDLEYLLNRKGTWRLKAYNHFNDQNYYLKSALTTQGIGIVWRKDFGIPTKKEKVEEEKEENKELD